MSAVTRYDLEQDILTDSGEMKPTPDGEYVLFSDYAALRAERDKLRGDVQHLLDTCVPAEELREAEAERDALLGRQGCRCRCCDHAEGSDCACDCHASGLCSSADVIAERDAAKEYSLKCDQLRWQVEAERDALQATVQRVQLLVLKWRTHAPLDPERMLGACAEELAERIGMAPAPTGEDV